jgi:UDP-hydrolysing UDP-N-acetyl-D-glucosamine 2-epimerase
MRRKRTICFVTGTRAEFGLMQSTLAAIRKRCTLQIIVTGMHLSREHGRSIDAIRQDGWKIDAVVPWSRADKPIDSARATGRAMAGLAAALRRLNPDVLLVVGDRVEAFAAAAAGHIGGIVVAHVHGGDRALGQADDSLRHAITKLAHIHFPATKQSAMRIHKMGEQPFRIHRVGSPGIDAIAEAAMNRAEPRRRLAIPAKTFALLVLHPADADNEVELGRAEMIYSAVREKVKNIVVVYPNNDPGSGGIIRCWKGHDKDAGVVFLRNVPRAIFLGLLRDAAMLVGNSSAGIIEAASFGTPVIDIGPRQRGRERGENIAHVAYQAPAIRRAIDTVCNGDRPKRFASKNIYGRGNTADRIAAILANIALDVRLRRKLIGY